MTPLDKQKVDFLQTILNYLIEKIEPNNKFLNDRIKEWCKNIPTPETSKKGSEDEAALTSIEEIHNELLYIYEINSLKGIRWPNHINKTYEELIERFREIVSSSDIDQSIINLYHLHYSNLLKSQGKYKKAIQEIKTASKIIQDTINSHDMYLPRYNRNIILNLGLISELNRLRGKIDTSIKYAEKMLEESKKSSMNKEFIKLDTKKGFSPVESSSLYYLCESHLSVDNWDDKKNKSCRDWVFRETFSNNHYQKWVVPTLVQIIGNQIWKNRYPDYYEQMANLIYINTADTRSKTKLRELSVILGRIKIKPLAPITAALAIIVVLSFASNSGIFTNSEQLLDKSIENAQIEYPNLNTSEVQSIKNMLLSSLNEHGVGIAQLDVINNKIQEILLSSLNEHGIGIAEVDTIKNQVNDFLIASLNEQGIGVAKFNILKAKVKEVLIASLHDQGIGVAQIEAISRRVDETLIASLNEHGIGVAQTLKNKPKSLLASLNEHGIGIAQVYEELTSGLHANEHGIGVA